MSSWSRVRRWRWAVPLVLGVLVVGCRNKDDGGSGYYNGYRTGAACSDKGTCPPGQKCDASRICRVPCTRIGPCSGGGNCECSGGSCDGDFFCRPSCGSNSSGGSMAACDSGRGGPSCGSDATCDMEFNVCRPLCGGAACPANSECVTSSSGGCSFCRGKFSLPDGGARDGVGFDAPETGGCLGPGVQPGSSCAGGGGCPACLSCSTEGICRRRCTSQSDCNENPSFGERETCDIDGFCRLQCGTGSPTFTCNGGRPNCEHGLTCDRSNNVCREACTPGCPVGLICAAGPGDDCRLCRPSKGSGETYMAIAIVDRESPSCSSTNAPGADIDAVELIDGSSTIGVGLRGSAAFIAGGSSGCSDGQCSGGFCKYAHPSLVSNAEGPRDGRVNETSDDTGYFALNGGAVGLEIGDLGGGGSAQAITASMTIKIWEIDRVYRDEGLAPPTCVCAPERYDVYVFPTKGSATGMIKLTPTRFEPTNQPDCRSPADLGCGTTTFRF